MSRYSIGTLSGMIVDHRGMVGDSRLVLVTVERDVNELGYGAAETRGGEAVLVPMA